MLKRLILPLVLLIASSSALTALAQEATPETDDAIERHLTWVLDLFENGADDLTVAEVEEHFDELFLGVVPADEFIASIQQLQGSLGALEMVDDQSGSAGPGEFSGLFRSASDELVVISFAVDPETGLMSGFFITPARSAPASPVASPVATPVGTPVASPAASPVARGPVVADPAAQIALYEEKTEAIRAVGEPVVTSVVAGDHAAVEPYLAPQVAQVLDASSLADVIASYTTDQVQMTYGEAGVRFFGHWNDDVISGVMIQRGAPTPFGLQADEVQEGDLPTGHWSGSFPQLGLGFEVTFGTDGGNLTATLDIPAQNIADVALTDVRYLPELAIGDQVDLRVFAPGGASDSYTADFAWGDALLRVSVGVDVKSDQVTSIQMLPAIPVPPRADDAPVASASYQLPFDGTWWVFWGGKTELHNYHAAVSSQRFAYDLVVWKDGATFTGDGMQNEDYWAWGQPVLAPADGTVIEVVNDDVDQPPQRSGQPRSQPGNPAGNHVVLQTAEGEYVFIAHMQQGSVQVAVGDEVEAGDPLGLTGNSGNTSEPHVHIHIQDSPDILDFNATGIPLRFTEILVDGEPVEDALPVQGSFVANP